MKKHSNKLSNIACQVAITFVMSMASAAGQTIWYKIIEPKIMKRFEKNSRVGFL